MGFNLNMINFTKFHYYPSLLALPEFEPVTSCTLSSNTHYSAITTFARRQCPVSVFLGNLDGVVVHIVKFPPLPNPLDPTNSTKKRHFWPVHQIIVSRICKWKHRWKISWVCLCIRLWLIFWLENFPYRIKNVGEVWCGGSLAVALCCTL